MVAEIGPPWRQPSGRWKVALGALPEELTPELPETPEAEARQAAEEAA